jgi:hypothetical protein
MHGEASDFYRSPDEYPWEGRNSFNSGIFVILKKLWTLNYRSPLLSSQFLPALMLKSSLTVYIFFGLYPFQSLHWLGNISLYPFWQQRSVFFNIHSSHPYKTLFGNIIKVFLDKIQRYNELKYRGTKGVLNHVRIYKENFIIIYM